MGFSRNDASKEHAVARPAVIPGEPGQAKEDEMSIGDWLATPFQGAAQGVGAWFGDKKQNVMTQAYVMTTEGGKLWMAVEREAKVATAILTRLYNRNYPNYDPQGPADPGGRIDANEVLASIAGLLRAMYAFQNYAKNKAGLDLPAPPNALDPKYLSTDASNPGMPVGSEADGTGFRGFYTALQKALVPINKNTVYQIESGAASSLATQFNDQTGEHDG